MDAQRINAKRILVIDDDEDIREIAKISLEMQTNLEVILAGTSEEGIAAAIAQQPDAILLDVMLPDLDGIETFKRLQANPLTASIPVMFLTAKVHAEDQRLFSRLGIKAIIVKPFKPAQLAFYVTGSLGWNLR